MYSPCKTCGKPAKDVLCHPCWKASQVTRPKVLASIQFKYAEIKAITGLEWYQDTEINEFEAYTRHPYSRIDRLIEILNELQDYLNRIGEA